MTKRRGHGKTTLPNWKPKAKNPKQKADETAAAQRKADKAAEKAKTAQAMKKLHKH